MATSSVGTPFSRWYKKHGAEYNKSRAVRYKADHNYRQSILERQSAVRAKEREKRSQGPIQQYRAVDGNRVKVFRIGITAKLIGVSEATIRKWEADRLLPTPTINGKQRYYTEAQIALIKGLAEVALNNRYNRLHRKQLVEAKSRDVFKRW